MRNYLNEEFRVGDKVASARSPSVFVGIVHDLYLTDDSAEACWVGDKVTGGEFLLDNLTKLKSIQIPQTPGISTKKFIVIDEELLNSRIEEQRKHVNSSDIDSIYFEIQFLKALKAASFPAEEVWQATKVIERDEMTGFAAGNLFPTYEDFIKTKP